MWLCAMPCPPNCLELIIYSREDIGSIRLWNYNKSLLDSVKGLKEVEVLLNQ
jgi:hypothetical protein